MELTKSEWRLKNPFFVSISKSLITNCCIGNKGFCEQKRGLSPFLLRVFETPSLINDFILFDFCALFFYLYYTLRLKRR